MSMQSEGRDAKGRNFHQTTKNGTGSAASVGPGGTGTIGRMSGDVDANSAGNAREGGAGNEQSCARTDDWLSSGSEQERKQGFRPSEPRALETGMEGLGAVAGNKAGNKASNRQ